MNTIEIARYYARDYGKSAREAIATGDRRDVYFYAVKAGHWGRVALGARHFWSALMLVLALPALASAQGLAPFSSTYERGPAVDLETHVLTRRNLTWAPDRCQLFNPYQGQNIDCGIRHQDFLWYQKSTGAYWMVVTGDQRFGGIRRDCVLIGSFDPGSDVTIIDLDGDYQDDLMTRAPDGVIGRHRITSFGACHGN